MYTPSRSKASRFLKKAAISGKSGVLTTPVSFRSWDPDGRFTVYISLYLSTLKRNQIPRVGLSHRLKEPKNAGKSRLLLKTCSIRVTHVPLLGLGLGFTLLPSDVMAAFDSPAGSREIAGNMPEGSRDPTISLPESAIVFKPEDIDLTP